jgi:hypothetical protein
MKFLFLFFLASCAQVTTLNMKKHQFGVLPTKIIWFQIAGLEEEHLAMLRFPDSGDKRTSFEDNICIGKTWAYNLYELRTAPQVGFLSELTGKKNVKNNCEDAQLRPIWNYLSSKGYNTGILEAGATKEQSIISLNQCGENGLVFLSSLYLWLKRQPASGADTYSSAEPISLKPNQLLFDRSCGTNVCTSSIRDDFRAIYSRFSKSSHKNLFIVRDFSYLAALEKKDFARAKEILADIEKAYEFANKYTEAGSDHLVLLTTASSRYIDLPNQGKDWYEFDKTNKNAEVKKSKLTNLVIANGMRSENFCGMYEDYQIFERILSGPKQQGHELMIINPFK